MAIMIRTVTAAARLGPAVHRLQQPSINRREKHRHDDRPENGAIERVQHPGKRQRDGREQQQKTLMFDPSHGPSRCLAFARPIATTSRRNVAAGGCWRSAVGWPIGSPCAVPILRVSRRNVVGTLTLCPPYGFVRSCSSAASSLAYPDAACSASNSTLSPTLHLPRASRGRSDAEGHGHANVPCRDSRSGRA